MRRSVLAWAAVGLVAATSAPILFAADAPAPVAVPTDDDPRIARLVEDLGSDDFRVREAATKALADMGEKARPALEAAMKSDSPAVRFRAEQILERLNGAPREKPLGEGIPPPGTPAPPNGPRPRRLPPDIQPEDVDREMNRLREEMDRKMKEVEELFRSGKLDFPWGESWGPLLRRDGSMKRASKEIRLKVDGGEMWAELIEGPRGAKIIFTEKAEPENVTIHSGPSIAKILASRPQVRDWPGGTELIARYEAEKKAREDAARAAREADPAMPRGTVVGRSVQIIQTPQGVKVTISEPGPDGKPISKTYEGTDLETLKREHPEIGDSFGGFTLRLGPLAPTPPTPPTPPAGPFGERPLGPPDDVIEDEDSEIENDLPMPRAIAPSSTGPYGLAMAPVDERLGGHLGLKAGHGALVIAVRPNSEAEKVGLRVDDVITAIGETPVTTADGAAWAIRTRTPGATLTFHVIRAGKPTTLPKFPGK
jgi:hypothetical protein